MSLTLRSNADQPSPGTEFGQTPSGSDESRGPCVPNISKAERRKRLIFGIVAFVFSLGVLAVLLATGTDRAWRVVMLPLFWGSAIGFFQWWDKT